MDSHPEQGLLAMASGSSRTTAKWPPRPRDDFSAFVQDQYICEQKLAIADDGTQCFTSRAHCKHCNLTLTFNISRMKSHFTGLKAGTSKVRGADGRAFRVSDVKTCSAVPGSIQTRMRQLYTQSHRMTGTQEVGGLRDVRPNPNDPSVVEEVVEMTVPLTPMDVIPESPRILSSGSSSLHRVMSQTAPSLSSTGAAPSPPATSACQASLPELFQRQQHEELHLLWAKAFLTSGWAFRTAENPYFQAALKQTSRVAGFPGPREKRMRTRDLQTLKAQCKKEVDSLLEVGYATKATLTSDGWTNVHGRPLVNILVVCTKGEFFLKAIDAGTERKTAEWIADILLKEVEVIGPKNLVQLVTDNAGNCKKAGRIVRDAHPHIVWGGCAAHGLDLVCEDWGKFPWLSNIFQRCREMVQYIKRHHYPSTLFEDKYMGRLRLLLPGATRFATNFLMIERAYLCKTELRQMMVGDEWESYVDTLNSVDGRARAKEMRDLMLDETYWKQVGDVRVLMEHVFKLLRAVDSQKPMMGEIYWKSFQLQKYILHAWDDRDMKSDILTPERCQDMARIFGVRWGNWTNILHTVSLMLNPKYLFDRNHSTQSYER